MTFKTKFSLLPVGIKVTLVWRLLIIVLANLTNLLNLNQNHQIEASPGQTNAQLLQQNASRIWTHLGDNKSASAGDELLVNTKPINSAPIEPLGTEPKPANNLESSALNYLQKYGYMSANSNSETNNLISEDSFAGAIKDFQRFAGIKQTGIVDGETLRLMRTPRCGNTDKATGERTRQVANMRISTSRRGSLIMANSMIKRRRRKRYALQGSKWRRQILTYRISQYPTRFNERRHEVDSQIEKAFGIWSQVAPIDFVVKKEGRVHIDIRFASGDHGDGDAFDGPGNTLAHAYFPQYGGDAHFDDQEYWTVDSYTGTNIFQVAAHELGHSLGLGHSNVREALMAPFYQKYKPNFKLHVDDVLAIQALYGDKHFLPQVPAQQPSTSTSTTSSTTTTTTSTSTTARPFEANVPRFSGGSRGSGGKFKPTFYGPRGTPDGREQDDYEENGIQDPSVLSTNGISPLPGQAVPRPNGQDPYASYPADLCSDPVIDAVTRTDDGNSYVFKGDFYWMLTSDGIAKGYPRHISTDWDGLPGSLDAALTWADGKTFFFKGNKYWRFRNKRRDVGYPKLISAGFAGIPDDIDAAFVWSGNGRTYMFKGAEYWRFDSKADPPVASDYPKSVKIWNGVPAHINAAFRWENNVTYFFKGNQYYRFNDKDFKVESRGRPAFPRNSAEWWFGCIDSNLAQKAMAQTELLDESESHERQPKDQDIDWSFLAGLDESSKSMGTHIRDLTPSLMPTNEEQEQVNSGIDNKPMVRQAKHNLRGQESKISLFNSSSSGSSMFKASTAIIFSAYLMTALSSLIAIQSHCSYLQRATN